MRPSTARPALDRLRIALDQLPRVVASLPKDRLGEASDRFDANSWSPRDVMVHLADAEMVHAVRLKLVVSAERPQLVAYDQDAWAKRFSSLETTAQAVGRWRALRESNVRLLETLTDAEWRRIGVHEERGEESVERLVDRMVDHDHDHLTQMQAAVTA